jgi:hypothetical protein
MKKLIYTEGPIVMTCGIAGEFRLGVPREVSDDLAAILLRKGRLKEFKETPPEGAGSPASRKAQRKEE